MNILLDTCSFLWAAQEPDRLSGQASSAVNDPGGTLFLSVVSIWEVSVKYRLGRLKITATPKALMQQAIEDLQLEPLPLQLDDAILESALPPHHNDPFDRMLLCQAMAHSLTILTPDRLIRQYGVPCLW